MIILMLLPASSVSLSTFSDIVFAMVIISLVLSPALFKIPTQTVSTSSHGAAEGASSGTPVTVVLALISVLLFFSAASGMWAFLERIGANQSFDQTRMSDLLGFTLITATAGSLVTAWLGDKFGNRPPFFASVIVFIVSIATLSGSPNFESFAGAALIMTFVVGVGLPLVVAEVAARDADNRYVVMTVPAVGLGAMIGPPLFGFLAESGGVTVSIFACAGIAILSAALLRR
jgi:AAHS family benzoate transporter-like MFS transporter